MKAIIQSKKGRVPTVIRSITETAEKAAWLGAPCALVAEVQCTINCDVGANDKTAQQWQEVAKQQEQQSQAALNIASNSVVAGQQAGFIAVAKSNEAKQLKEEALLKDQQAEQAEREAQTATEVAYRYSQLAQQHKEASQRAEAEAQKLQDNTQARVNVSVIVPEGTSTTMTEFVTPANDAPPVVSHQLPAPLAPAPTPNQPIATTPSATLCQQRSILKQPARTPYLYAELSCSPARQRTFVQPMLSQQVAVHHHVPQQQSVVEVAPQSVVQQAAVTQVQLQTAIPVVQQEVIQQQAVQQPIITPPVVRQPACHQVLMQQVAPQPLVVQAPLTNTVAPVLNAATPVQLYQNWARPITPNMPQPQIFPGVQVQTAVVAPQQTVVLNHLTMPVVMDAIMPTVDETFEDNGEREMKIAMKRLEKITSDSKARSSSRKRRRRQRRKSRQSPAWHLSNRKDKRKESRKGHHSSVKNKTRFWECLNEEIDSIAAKPSQSSRKTKSSSSSSSTYRWENITSKSSDIFKY